MDRNQFRRATVAAQAQQDDLNRKRIAELIAAYGLDCGIPEDLKQIDRLSDGAKITRAFAKARLHNGQDIDRLAKPKQKWRRQLANAPRSCRQTSLGT